MGIAAKAGPAKISGLLSPKVAAAAAAEDKMLRRERFNISALLENRRMGRWEMCSPCTYDRSAERFIPSPAEFSLMLLEKADAVGRRKKSRSVGNKLAP